MRRGALWKRRSDRTDELSFLHSNEFHAANGVYELRNGANREGTPVCAAVIGTANLLEALALCNFGSPWVTRLRLVMGA